MPVEHAPGWPKGSADPTPAAARGHLRSTSRRDYGRSSTAGSWSVDLVQRKTPCIRTRVKRSAKMPVAMPIKARKLAKNSKAAFLRALGCLLLVSAASRVCREALPLSMSKRATAKLPFLTRCGAPNKELPDDKFSRVNRRARHKEHVNRQREANTPPLGGGMQRCDRKGVRHCERSEAISSKMHDLARDCRVPGTPAWRAAVRGSSQ
jgi:hypothetical protein